MSDAIDAILAAKQKTDSASKFYSVLKAEGLNEDFLEIQFRNGVRACLSYDSLTWFSYSPDDGIIDLEFGGFLVMIKGRGLLPNLFNGIKTKRVAWVREADSDFQDNPDFECFIESIHAEFPEGFGSETGE